VQIHGDTSFPCVRCGKTFKTKKYLQQHESLYCSNRPRDEEGKVLKKPKKYPRKARAEKVVDPQEIREEFNEDAIRLVYSYDSNV